MMGRKEVVVRMLNKGTFSMEQIAEMSGFSIDEIKQLQEPYRSLEER